MVSPDQLRSSALLDGTYQNDYNIGMPRYDLEAIKRGESPSPNGFLKGPLSTEIPIALPVSGMDEIRSHGIDGEILEGDSPYMEAAEASEILPPVYIPSYLRKIPLELIIDHKSAMHQLNANLPTNDWDLPEFMFRADLITADGLKGLHGDRESQQRAIDMLDAARIHIDYEEGYPVYNGNPLWHQYPWEPNVAYQAFKMYLELLGVRRLDHLNSFQGTLLREWFHMYMWQHRVAAYDMYISASHAKQKIQLAQTIEGKHFVMAGKLIDELMGLFKEDGYLSGTNVTPKQAVEMIERLSKIQRVSVGLPANGGKDVAIAPPSVSVTMTQIAESTGKASTRKDDEQKERIDELLKDPDKLAAAQKLIIDYHSQA